MGKSRNKFPLISALTKYLFFADAKGVGKYNFCYKLLEQLADNDVKILVIEPYKSEYAIILGDREDFHVSDAVTMSSSLLRINLVAFSEGISTTQYTDRFLSSFNTPRTIYDAMPAILKNALKKIYPYKGLDLYFGGKPDGAFITSVE